MPASLIHRRRQRPPCPCGQCDTAHGFCDGHAARLAKLRDEYEDAAKTKCASTGNKLQKKVRAPTCCLPTCWNPRLPGQAFCDSCSELGYADGIGE